MTEALLASLRRSVVAPLERRLAQCVRIAEAIADGDHRRRVPAGQTHEFAQLAGNGNRIAEHLLAATLSRLRIKRLATMGRIAAGVVHEIGNPVTAIANYANATRLGGTRRIALRMRASFG